MTGGFRPFEIYTVHGVQVVDVFTRINKGIPKYPYHPALFGRKAVPIGEEDAARADMRRQAVRFYGPNGLGRAAHLHHLAQHETRTCPCQAKGRKKGDSLLHEG